MLALILDEIPDIGRLLRSPVLLLVLAFQIWMLIDAIRRGEWVWAVLILIFQTLTAFWYYFTVYRGSISPTQGFELPGAHSRRRIKELEGKIHHLDQACHYLELADIYFQKGNLKKAEELYRASLQRDPNDIDARAHLGQCLLRAGQLAEARGLLVQACAENPRHDYGHTQMACAECLAALGEDAPALAVWREVLANHSYARAYVQYAELAFKNNDKESARAAVREVLADSPHVPAYQRKRDRVWVRRAKRLQRQLN